MPIWKAPEPTRAKRDNKENRKTPVCRLAGRCFFSILILVSRLCLGDSSDGALSFASTAINAGICIDLEVSISLRDCTYGALSSAGSTADAVITNNTCHTEILLSNNRFYLLIRLRLPDDAGFYFQVRTGFPARTQKTCFRASDFSPRKECCKEDSAFRDKQNDPWHAERPRRTVLQLFPDSSASGKYNELLLPGSHRTERLQPWNPA